MILGTDQTVAPTAPPRPSAKRKRILIAAYSFFALDMAFSGWYHFKEHWGGRWEIILTSVAAFSALYIVAFELFPFSVARVLGWSYIGRKEFQIADPDIEKRVRSRYYEEMKELESIGFTPVFFLGESKSVVSFFLILPALVYLMMRYHGAVLGRLGGFRYFSAEVVSANHSGSAYAAIFSLGVVFRTKLKDGTIISTDNFGPDLSEGKRLRFGKRGASIATAWERHADTIQSYEAHGNPVLMEIGFEPYTKLGM